MAKRKKYYMHLLDGEPAYYVPGDQICFASRKYTRFPNNMLVESKAQILKEQTASQAFTRKHLAWKAFDHDYIVVFLPTPQTKDERQ